MKRIVIIICMAVIALPVVAFEPLENTSSSINIGDFTLTPSESNTDAVVITSNCNYPDTDCWNSDTEQVKTSWWQKFVNFFKQIFGYSEISFSSAINQAQSNTNEKTISTTVTQVNSAAQLLRTYSLINYWCSVQHISYEDIQKCEEKHLSELRKQGDLIKEKLLNEIKENDGSLESYQKIVQLDALLKAATTASGEGTYFSTGNILRVQGLLNKKMQNWWLARIHKSNLAELWNLYPFAQAYSKASDGSGLGLMEGSHPSNRLAYRVRRAVLQEMMAIDICMPEQEKLKQLQNQLQKPPGCEKMLANKKACDYIAKGNLEAAYSLLYEQDRGDAANKEKPNQAEPPIDCTKPTTLVPTATPVSTTTEAAGDKPASSTANSPETGASESQELSDIHTPEPERVEIIVEPGYVPCDENPENNCLLVDGMIAQQFYIPDYNNNNRYILLVDKIYQNITENIHNEYYYQHVETIFVESFDQPIQEEY